MRLSVSVASVRRALLSIIACLVVLSLLGWVARFRYGRVHLGGLIPLFDLPSEANVPTFFSSLCLLSCGLLSSLIARALQHGGQPWVRHWRWLGRILAFLAADEAAQIHEKLIEPTRKLLPRADGVLHFAWVLPFGVFVLVLAASYFKWWLALPAAIRIGFALAAASYVGGALGLELLGELAP